MSDLESAVAPAYTQERRFWELIVTAALLGAWGAVVGLVFLGVTGVGADWYGDPGSGWFEGEVWWIAVAGAAGLIVGLLRHVLTMPAKTPGIIADLKTQQIDMKMVPKVVAISAVSLIGGASIGPEVALGQMGGGAGGYIAKRRGLDEDDSKDDTLSGIAGAFGGLFSSPLVATILMLEVGQPQRQRYGRAFYGSVIASSTAFGIYFAIAGSVFMGLYEVPQYQFEDWYLLAGIGLGLYAAVVVLVTLAVISLTKRLVTRLSIPTVPLAVIGGLIFGLIGVVLPLTNFTGTDQLGTVLSEASTLGIGLVAALVIGKMLAFAVSVSTGFIGGPIFPILFIGGTAGILANLVIPDLPLALTFTCMLAAVPGSLVAAPFSLVLLAALLTQVGAIETAPILIATATSFLTIAGVKRVVTSRRAGHAPSK